MSYTHPEFGIVTPDNQTKAKDLGTELKQMGATIEATLKSFDYNGADPNAVLAKVAALEQAVNGLFTTEPTWISVPIGVGTLEYAVLRGDVLVRAQITTSMAAGATITFGNLPAEVRPGVSEPINAYATGAQLSALALNTGDVRLVNHSAGTSNNTKIVSGRWAKRAA